jgi:hypothetical protein
VRVEIRPYNFGVGGVVGVADLRREGVSEEITLGGLSEHEVGELIDATSNLELRPGFVHSVRRETDDNPFFVQEICSHVGETGEPAGAFTLEALGVPEGVKQVIGRRIARLPEGTERLLTIAAVIGRGFDLDVLVDVAGDDEDDVLTRSSGRARPGSSTRTRAPSVAIRSCTPSPGTRSTTRSASPAGRGYTAGWPRRSSLSTPTTSKTISVRSRSTTQRPAPTFPRRSSTRAAPANRL